MIVVVLLKSVDASLVDMNDLSLIIVCWVIIDDIVSFFVVLQVDYDGIIFKFNQFLNQVDNLCLVDNDSDGLLMDFDGEEFFSFISEWCINL